MTVPLLDLTRQYTEIQAEMEAAALGVLRSCRYILGPEVEGLERELAAYLGCRHVVALSSGTDALLAAMMAHGIGPGDEVAMPVYSFFATAGAVARTGAKPVFVDIEPRFCNIDPAALERVLRERPRVKAVMIVHLYGAPADLEAIGAITRRHGVALFEDAAQAIGTRYQGRPVGAFGLAAGWSTFPSKNLGGCGDGGFLSTDDDAFAERVRRLRNHGQSELYRHEVVGGNFRMDALQAALLRVKLRHLERYTERRRANAALYAKLFREAGLGDVRLPEDVPDRHTYHQYVVHLPQGRRDAVREQLQAKGIGCAVYYPLAFHQQPCFQSLGYRPGDFPVAERAALDNLALPIFPALRPEEIAEVVGAVRAALQPAPAR